MKCKFYRGPWHGKVKDISDDALRHGFIQFQELSRRQRDIIDMRNSSDPPAVAVPYVTHRYDVKIISGTIAGQRFSSPAVHPDGSLFLEYSKPRRK